jgi:hypothetical protein
MKAYHWTAVAALVLTLTLTAAPARATTVIKISLQEMTLGSHTILQGTVAAARTIAVKGNERHLQTHVDIDVRNVFKGDKGMKTLRLELMGGKLGRWVMNIPGMPSFTPGEEVILFLEKTATNWALTGLSQGKFVVYQDAKGPKRVRRRLAGLHYVARDKTGRFAAVQAPKQRAQTVSSLVSEIRSYLRLNQPSK